ncbi:MAG: ABC transporter permease, partial [Pseudomonadota bacterium]
LPIGTGGEGDEAGDPLDFLRPPGVALARSQTLDALTGAADLPRLIAADNVPTGTLMTDIGTAERLLGRRGEIDRLVIAAEQPRSLPSVESIAPGLQRNAASEATADVARLTDSFHLNLSAFGLLSFAVGLFIVHATIALAFEQRRGVFRTLRTLGLSARGLTIALSLELLGFALLAGAAGVLLGYLVAAALLPDVAATLRGLYGADLSGQLAFRPQWWVSGLVIALLGTFAAAASSLLRLLQLPILASAQSRAWVMGANRSARLRTIIATGLLIASALALVFASGLVAAFATLGLLLVGAALLLPALFALVLRFGERMASGPLSQWFWADTRQQLPALSLALMALLLALSANIGVSTMVGSFRATFTGWLDQRLAAELYIRTDDEAQRDEVLAFLDGRVDAVLPIRSVKETLRGMPGEVFSMADHPTFRDNWPLLEQSSGAWDALAAGEGLLANEQLARREELTIGDTLQISGRSFPIVAIYSDYGNPAPQAILGGVAFQANYPSAPNLRFALRVPPERIEPLSEELRSRFGFADDAIINQDSIKALSVSIFERTFTVTDALNVLTLTVAAFAIFTSLLTLATMRLPQVAPLWAMGLTRKRLAGLELLRALMLAVLTAIAALPVGLALAWLLLAKVNVEAFGWRLPMQLFPGDWVWLGALALLAAVLAATIPAWRLSRTAPAELVKVFTHER